MIGEKRIVGVVQARMGSSRLPGKVLMPLAGRPVLWHVVHRLHSLTVFDEIVVATSIYPQDDGVVDLVERLGIPGVRAFRGSEDDVLERFYLALRDDPPDVVARVTGDTPLVSTEHLRFLLHRLVDAGLDGVDAHHEYTGLTLGFGSEAYTYRALVDAHLLSADATEREHVSLFIKRRPHVFRIEYPKPDPALCSSLRLTLDYPDDYQVLRRVYEELYRPGEMVSCKEVLRWLSSRPEVTQVNEHCRQISA